MTNGFDPIISLKAHIALLTMLQSAREEVGRTKGIPLLAAKAFGRIITEELTKSRETMKVNKMWVHENPVADRRYRYSLFGKREEYEISQADLDAQVRMTLIEIERVLEK